MISSSILSCPQHLFPAPILYDDVTNEPYLPLLPPHGPRIRLTPPRIDDTLSAPNDVARLVELHNLPEIWPYLTGPPWPFREEDAIAWLKRQKEACVRAREGRKVVDGSCPVTFIRERQDDGTDILLGEAAIRRSEFEETPDPEERARLAAQNASYEAGDPRIVYSFGYFLSPTHHGRGIMAAVVHTLIDSWAKPVMGAKRFEGSAMSHNIASQKVFLKNGFHLVEERADAIDMKALGKGEGKVGLRMYERIEV